MRNQFLNTGFTPIRTLANAKNLDKPQPCSGFTLIELLVTISLVAFLFTIGFTSYLDFSRRQTVYQAARQIVEDLRLAQSLAANNQKPSGSCGVLNGYTFRFFDKTKYYVDVDCSNPTYNNTVKEGSLPSGLTLSGFTKVTFKVLRQTLDCDSTSPCQLTVQDASGHKKIIDVGTGGTINIEGE